MAQPDPSSREFRAAREFLAYKGYPDVRPYDVEKIEDEPVWYFLYDLPEGVLELEVEYFPRTDQWGWTVTSFQERDVPIPA